MSASSSPAKRFKEMYTGELLDYRDEIKKINSNLSETEENADPLQEDELGDEDTKSLRKYIREQIRMSERRIHERLDSIEHKINRLLEKKLEWEEQQQQQLTSGVQVDDIIEEYVEEDGGIDEFSSQIFPINDEDTFDWFFQRLANESYRNTLVQRRWQLTRNCGTRSFNVSVKDFIRMHFELAICIKYSVSGYGSRGTKKKKLDSQSLGLYVFDCFNKSQPGIHSFQEVSRAIVQFWGRSQDTYTKSGERAVRNDFSTH